MFEKKLTDAESYLVAEARQDALKYSHAAECAKNKGIQIINQKRADMLNGLLAIINRSCK